MQYHVNKYASATGFAKERSVITYRSTAIT